MNSETQPLTSAEREARAEYFRAWRAKNKDKVKIYNQRYWQRKAAALQEATENGKKDI